MKTLITLITLLASVAVFAGNMNREHKDWSWSTEMNQHGSFIASTSAATGANAHFFVAVTPRHGRCLVEYSLMLASKNLEGVIDGSTLDGVTVQFYVDNVKAWSAETSSYVTITDDTALYNSVISGDKVTTSLKHLLKGSKLGARYVVDGKATPTNHFSLMGSSVAMTAVYDRCQQHVTAFPDYDAYTDSRAAVQKKAQQTVADKAATI